jgi:hypothetical protein
MFLLALSLFASPALAGGGGASAGGLGDEPADLLDGQCWTCEIELTVYGCAGPAYQDVTFEADATSAQGCADELYDVVDDYLTTFACIEEVRDADFNPFVLTQGSVNQRISLMEFDPLQDVMECDSSTWVPVLEADPVKYRP